MAIVLGFGAELQGLRRLSPRIAGVLMALDPAVAFFVGWLLLDQRVTAGTWWVSPAWWSRAPA